MSLSHGTIVYATVRCVNHVELSADVASEAVVVTSEPPSTKHASAKFIKLSQRGLKGSDMAFNMRPKVASVQVFVQTDSSSVLLEWMGFEDVTGVDHYEYRLLWNDHRVLDWTGSGKKTCVSIFGLDLQDNIMYKAEVRALNSGHYTSVPVQSLLLVQRKEPKLTGNLVYMSFSQLPIDSRA